MTTITFTETKKYVNPDTSLKEFLADLSCSFKRRPWNGLREFELKEDD